MTLEPSAVVRIDDGQTSGIAPQTVRRPCSYGRESDGDHGAVEPAGGDSLVDRNGDRVEVERWQPVEPLVLGQFRILDVHHNDAGREPEREKRAHSNTEPAVHEKEGTFDAELHDADPRDFLQDRDAVRPVKFTVKARPPH